MEVKRCFEPGCMHDVEYACWCTSRGSFSCEQHFGKHLKLPNRTHNFDSIFVEPCEGTKEELLKILIEENSKHKQLKEGILASFSQLMVESEICLKELIKEIDSHLNWIDNAFSKISQARKISKLEQDPILELLSSKPAEAAERVKRMIKGNSDWCNSPKLFYALSEKIEKVFGCFIQDKVEAYLGSQLINIGNILKEINAIINSVNEPITKSENDKLENIKASVFKLIKENEKSQREFEGWQKRTRSEKVNETNLEIARINEDRGCKINNEAKYQNSIQINVTSDKNEEVLIAANNTVLKEESKENCHIYNESDVYESPFQKVDKNDANISLQCLYIVGKDDDDNNKSLLIIYNTESGRNERIALDTPELLSFAACTALLPNGNLFCFGSYPASGITLLIDKNYRAHQLPSGTPCSDSSAIYYNKSVYCFGGQNIVSLNLSERFDLDENRWIKLNPLPKSDYYCSSIIFNENILISGYLNRNILRYSIDSNTFTTIPFEFAKNSQKILINGEILYLIESAGSIYESEALNDTVWRQVGGIRKLYFSGQFYCLYKKESVYIAISGKYHRFDFKQKSLTRIA